MPISAFCLQTYFYDSEEQIQPRMHRVAVQCIHNGRDNCCSEEIMMFTFFSSFILLWFQELTPTYNSFYLLKSKLINAYKIPENIYIGSLRECLHEFSGIGCILSKYKYKC